MIRVLLAEGVDVNQRAMDTNRSTAVMRVCAVWFQPLQLVRLLAAWPTREHLCSYYVFELWEPSRRSLALAQGYFSKKWCGFVSMVGWSPGVSWSIRLSAPWLPSCLDSVQVEGQADVNLENHAERRRTCLDMAENRPKHDLGVSIE